MLRKKTACYKESKMTVVVLKTMMYQKHTRHSVSVEEEDMSSQEEQDDCSNSTVSDEGHSEKALCSEDISMSISETPYSSFSTRKSNKKHYTLESLPNFQLICKRYSVIMNPVCQAASHVELSEWNENACKSCAPVLEKYSITFKKKTGK